MSYTKHTWVTGETITAEKLNNIEDGIDGIDGGKQNAPSTAGTAGQVLSLDNQLNPVWADQTITDYVASIGALGTVTLGTTWTGSDPYTSTVTVTGCTVTEKTLVNILPDSAVVEQMQEDGITEIYITNNGGTLTATAVGGVPTQAITLNVLCTESDFAADVDELSRQLNDETTGLDTKAPVIINTASGAIASFDDGADSMPVKKLVAQIEPVQDLHGYDNPWPAGGGKNLLFVDSKATGTLSGMTITSDDDFIYVNGTKYGSSQNLIASMPITLPSGTYYVRSFLLSGTYSTGSSFGIGLSIDSTTQLATDTITSEKAFTLESETTFYVNVISSDRNVISNVKVGVVISKTSGITQFSTYSNICPISGWTGAEIEQTGKNLADKSKFSIERPDWFPGTNWLGLTENADGTYTLTRPIGWGGYGMVYLGTFNPGTYTVSFDAISTANVRCTGALAVKKTGTWIDNVEVRSITVEAASRNSFAAFTTTEKCDFWLSVGPFTDNGAQVISGNYQVEIGTVSHEFSEYTGNQISVNWEDEAGTIYGGTVTLNEDGSADVAPNMAKTVFDGTQDVSNVNWRPNESSVGWLYSLGLTPGIKANTGTANIPNIISDVLPTVSYQGVYSGTADCISVVANSPTLGIAMRSTDTSLTTQTAINAYLTQHPVEVVYELATPESPIHIPDVGSLSTYLGTNNVWTDVGEVSVDYPADTKLYIDNKITTAIANALNS